MDTWALSTPMGGTTLDDRLRALAARRRRGIVGYFLGVDRDFARLQDLADFVVEREETVGVAEVDHHRGRVEADLHHVHLPFLERVDVLSYDPDRETVEYLGDSLVEDVMALLREGGHVPA